MKRQFTQAPQPVSQAGAFRSDAAYTFKELNRRGFGPAALREMQRNGLRSRECGRQKIVLGCDLLEFFESLEPVTLRATS